MFRSHGFKSPTTSKQAPIDQQHVSVPPTKNLPTPMHLPFTPSPSRITVHQCPSQFEKPWTALVLSLTLAQKIHNLILVSRQVEEFARGLFSKQLNEQEVAQTMQRLEEEYDSLREDVEYELETAWVDAGFLSEAIPNFQPINNKATTTDYSSLLSSTRLDGCRRNSDTVDKGLKRKAEVDAGEKTKNCKRLRKLEKEEVYGSVESDDSEKWGGMEVIEPIGLQQAMIPLTHEQKRRMQNWSIVKAGRNMDKEETQEFIVSPRGSFFVLES
jgi:hypothetical protein